jgi:hypothetical protein
LALSAFLDGQTAVGMQLLDALIAFILQTFGLRVDVNPRCLKQLEVMPTPFAKKQPDDFPSVLVDQNLTFERMPLFLAGIELTLTTRRTLIGLRPAKGVRGFGDINHDHTWKTKALHQLFLPWQAEAS